MFSQALAYYHSIKILSIKDSDLKDKEEMENVASVRNNAWKN